MKGIAPWLAAAALAAGAAGCGVLKDGTLNIGFGTVTYGGSDLVAPDGLKSYGNTFLKMQNKRGGDGAYGFVTSPFDLWAPFRWELSLGQFDPKSPGSGTGFSCTELDVRGSSPLEFYALCTRAEAGGYTCWVAKKGTSVVAQVFLAATGIVQGAVEHDGDSLNFMVKRPGDVGWTTITSIAQTPVAAFVPSIGFAQAPAGAQADFDDLRIVSNGPLPEGATQEQILARVVMDAGMPLAEAARDLDAGTLDLADAATRLEGAIAGLTAAETTVAEGAATLADPKAGARAVRWIRSARKDAERAGKTFEKGKARAVIAKAIAKALSEIYTATQALDPHTLPGG